MRWQIGKSITFSLNPGKNTLAIKGFNIDPGNGCNTGGFALACASTDPMWDAVKSDLTWMAWGSSLSTDPSPTWAQYGGAGSFSPPCTSTCAFQCWNCERPYTKIWAANTKQHVWLVKVVDNSLVLGSPGASCETTCRDSPGHLVCEENHLLGQNFKVSNNSQFEATMGAISQTCLSYAAPSSAGSVPSYDPGNGECAVSDEARVTADCAAIPASTHQRLCFW